MVSTRRDAGTIKVFIDKLRIKTFNLKGKNKPVRIEGVADVTATP